MIRKEPIGMQNIETHFRCFADTAEEAEEFKKKYLQQYPVRGYQTTVTNPVVNQEGRLVFYVHRFNSCD